MHHKRWETDFFHLWCRSMKIIDMNYLRPECNAQFQHLQAFFCYLKTCAFNDNASKPKNELFWRQSLFNKTLSTKHVHSLPSHSWQVRQPENRWAQERECVVVDWEESCCWFSSLHVNFLVFDFRLDSSCSWQRISQQQLFATYSNNVGVWFRPLKCSRKLSVRPCEAYMLNWAFKPWRGQVTQQTWQNLLVVFPDFSVPPRFPPVFPGFSRFCRAQSDSRQTVLIALWCAETTVNFKFMLVPSQLQSGSN